VDVKTPLGLEECHAIGYGQEDEFKAFELHYERIPAMPRTAPKVSYRKSAIPGTAMQAAFRAGHSNAKKDKKSSRAPKQS